MLGQNPGQGKNLPFISQQFPYISRQKMEMPGITPSRLKTEADIDNLSEGAAESTLRAIRTSSGVRI